MRAETKKKILMLIPGLGFGGAQKVFYNLGYELSNSYEIVECAFNNDETAAYPTANQVYYLDVKGGHNYLAKSVNFFKRIVSLNRVNKTVQPDIVISHLEGADYINLLSNPIAKRIICIHGTKLHDKKIQKFNGFIRKKILIPFLYRKADHIVTVSEEIRNELINHFNISQDKISTINNWFDTNKIQRFAQEQIEEKYSVLFESPTAILSGRFDIQKNFIAFLDIIQRVIEEKPNYKFIFLGEGVLKNEILEKTKRLQLKFHSPWENNSDLKDANVIYLGYQSNPFKFLAKADIFILPSLWEGFPMAVGEAMACSLPIISSNCPTGPAEMLGHSLSFSVKGPTKCPFGILLPSPDIDKNNQLDWKNTIIELLSDEKLRRDYSKKSDERIKEYSKDKIIANWHTLINKQLEKSI